MTGPPARLETDFSPAVRDARIETPFLVIGGRQDLPGFQEEHLRKTFGAWYPNAVFTFITDAGHYPMHETPVYLASVIERFLREHVRARSGE
jgi:pimeloyl-ACP methyl ester carboxylesterase